MPGWTAKLPEFAPEDGPMATRQAVKACIDATGGDIPGLMPGSADLTGNTGMAMAGAIAQSIKEPGGDLIHFGIREHGMGGVMTGLAAHRGVLPVGGTFFVFSDYMRGAVRVAALSDVHVIYSWTHDSIGLGQDGPTHQPIEQLAAVRAMPNLRVIRPADANETAAAWRIAVDETGPTALILSRQELPVLAETVERAGTGVPLGAYVLRDVEDGRPEVVLIGTGSEVHLCLDAADLLASTGVHARVVSFPSWELFALQPDEYRSSVLPDGIPRLAVEAATSFGWERYADATVCIDHFGASAPGDVALEEFGFTPQNVATRAITLLAGTRTS
jgi:transketolase